MSTKFHKRVGRWEKISKITKCYKNLLIDKFNKFDSEHSVRYSRECAHAAPRRKPGNRGVSLYRRGRVREEKRERRNRARVPLFGYPERGDEETRIA